ncbi:MAG: hypothetical protein GTO46_16085 [Gemmatimonadetes bacterium]|nr:hypothetical protein [Gemmatimonadota bacterium]NIO33228.1 hypothetical protein [Gemmatimonadota bacterium]
MNACKTPRTSRRARATAVLAFATAVLGACTPKAPEADIQAELARLRQEHQALMAEIVALRGEMRQLATGEAAPPSEMPAVIPPAPTLRQPARVASAAIAAVLDAYRQALEAEDLERVQQVYGGVIPAEDIRYLEIWFDRTDGLQVSMEPQSIEVHNGQADAHISQTMEYRLSRTAQRRRLRLDVRMTFERRGDEWQLIRVQARR